MTARADRTTYDDVPYESFPFPQTHPDRLAMLGSLFGMTPAAPDRCRVLELGCAAGGNLIPMAMAMPEAEFVGVDLSSVQVAQGERLITELGLRNIRLHAMSITAIDTRMGAFDYILSHGVYSWVPTAVQERMLEICSTQLNPQGIAYISYNTLPGWRMRGMIRDLMRYHAMQFADPGQRVAQARAILDFLSRSVPTENSAYGLLLKSELEGLRNSPDYYILHEHLEDINEPLYFHEFMERARGHGLQYLAEADASTMLAANFPAEVGETVRRIAPDVIRQEQFMDFLRNRTFRQTLLVREGTVSDRSLTPDRLRTLCISALLKPQSASPDLRSAGDESFLSANGGTLKTPSPVTKAAIMVLAQHWPRALPFADLLREALAVLELPEAQATHAGLSAEMTLASDLLQSFGAGLVELHAQPSTFVTRAGTHPTASPLARWQARRGLKQVTTLRHELVTIDANLGRLLSLLDGSRDRDAIYAKVMQWSRPGLPANATGNRQLIGAVRERVEQALTQIGRAALLMS